MSLRWAVRESTGIDDLTIGPVLLIHNFDLGEVDERPQFGLFFLCTTSTRDEAVTRPHRWIRGRDELEPMDLFHPLLPR